MAQNKRLEEYRGASREKLEREAEAAEKQVEDSEERCQEIVFKGKKYYSFTQKEWNQINKNVKTMIEDWIESEEDCVKFSSQFCS